MRKLFWLMTLLIVAANLAALDYPLAAKPDSAYLFAYTNGHEGRGGLYFAWSLDQRTWHPIGPEFATVRSDYGRWGSQKRMYDPVVMRDKHGIWHAVWTLNYQDGAFAYARSNDLVNWKPQSYPVVAAANNCLYTELLQQGNQFTVSWLSTNNSDTSFHAVSTIDFLHFSPTRTIHESDRINQRCKARIGHQMETGTMHRVEWKTIDNLLLHVELSKHRERLNSETTSEDAVRFANLKPLEGQLLIYPGETKNISELLMGIFFEDINYAADGGLYAELIQNRGFEYSSTDRNEWHSKSFWQLKGKQLKFEIATTDPVHTNNPHYAVLTIGDANNSSIINDGFNGIPIREGEKYDLSLFARILEGRNNRLKVRLIDQDGNSCGETTLHKLSTRSWKKFSAIITATKTTANARLEIIPQVEGSIALDMISLFPQSTFMGRKNGLRADLAQSIADLKPRFVRFPGGCVAHGDGIGNIYHWKNTIGPLEARKPQRNLWGYHQSAGLGYFEYFQFCKDLNAEPIPIVAAGVPCQNSAHHGCVIGGQQGGIPLDEMGAYIQDVLDMIEWANGDPKRNKWAKMRADAGHPEPFNLRYIGVGNEDLISDVFEERFKLIYDAIQQHYPEITVIGTAGPFSEGSDYTRGWAFATELGIPIIDEHYYQPPGWFIYNQDYYDKYDRNKSKVYLGEYAAHLPGRPTNLETALAEALHLISCERNGDIVEMTSYAPLFAKEGFTQWNPNLIYFNNTEVKPTVGYYTQQLFGVHAGDEYIQSGLILPTTDDKVRKRVAASVVRNTTTGKVIMKFVNLLPVEVSLNIPLDEFTFDKISKTVMSGQPADRGVRPVNVPTTKDELSNTVLPAYSLTVVRLN
jgi:alpha-L-arabinofuranosidase